MIQFNRVSKIFPDSRAAAVDEMCLDIPKGKICVFIGPSGCGKTTSLKMINRILEPTSGTINVNGTQNTNMDVIELRLNMGYVIQNIGLFPHMTIGDNVATVLKELKWSRERIDVRVNELLTMINLDPMQFRDRKPRQLSGGQQQRVGVARALAANPEIMLMDEPFGAVDPITRVRLQNEFLNLQKLMHKTIIMVTHDIDEAMKLGDSIAIMREGKLIQHTTPKELLKHPANDFVCHLIGNNRAIKQLVLFEAKECIREFSMPTLYSSQSVSDGIKALADSGTSALAIIELDKTLRGIVRASDLKEKSGCVGDFAKKPAQTIIESDSMNDALSVMLDAGEYYVAVNDSSGKYIGTITLEDVFRVVS